MIGYIQVWSDISVVIDNSPHSSNFVVFAALLFLPKDNTYGGWPSSGEIDLILSRGNRNYTNAEGKHIGVEQFESSIHYGPFASMDQASQFVRNSKPGNGFNNDFHRYQMEWTPGMGTFFSVLLINCSSY